MEPCNLVFNQTLFPVMHNDWFMKIATLLASAPLKFRLDFRLSRILLIIFPKFIAQILTDGLILDVAKHALTTGDN